MPCRQIAQCFLHKVFRSQWFAGICRDFNRLICPSSPGLAARSRIASICHECGASRLQQSPPLQAPLSGGCGCSSSTKPECGPRPDRYTPSINPRRHGGLAARERRSVDPSHAELRDGEIRAIRAGQFEAYACRVGAASHFFLWLLRAVNFSPSPSRTDLCGLVSRTCLKGHELYQR